MHLKWTPRFYVLLCLARLAMHAGTALLRPMSPEHRAAHALPAPAVPICQAVGALGHRLVPVAPLLPPGANHNILHNMAVEEWLQVKLAGADCGGGAGGTDAHSTEAKSVLSVNAPPGISMT